MYHNTVDSNPKYATARWYSLAKTYKSVMNHIFMMNKIIKKTNIPLFSRLRGVYGAEARKKGDVCFFLKSIKSKIVILSQFWDLQTLKA